MKVLLSLVLLVSTVAAQQCIVDLQHDDSYLRRKYFEFPTDAYTFMTWVKISDLVGTHIPLISYAPSASNTNGLLIALDQKSGTTYELRVWQGSKSSGVASTSSVSWTADFVQVAVTWRKSDGQLQFYLNGALVQTRTFQAGVAVGQGPEGCLIVGQEQDKVCGGFHAGQVLHGQVHDLSIWERVLTPTEITAAFSAGTLTQALDDDAVLHLVHKDVLDGFHTVWSGACEAPYCTVDMEHTSSYLFESGFQMPKTEISYMLWVRVSHGDSLVPLLSYATSNGRNNALLLYIDWKNDYPLRLYINNAAAPAVSVAGINWHEHWHQVGFTWKKSTGVADVFVDGVKAGSTTIKQGSDIWTSSTACFVIGQEQDRPCSGFQSSQVFHGRMHDIALFDRALTSAEFQAAYDNEKLTDPLKTDAVLHINKPGIVREKEVEWKSGCIDRAHPETTECVIDLEEDDSYLERTAYSFPKDEFTFSTYVNISRLVGDHIPLISYSPTTGGHNTVLVALPNTASNPFYGIRTWINNKAVPSAVATNPDLATAQARWVNTWNQVAVSWKKSTGELKTYLNGVLVDSSTVSKGQSITQNAAACLNIGQEQDSQCGSFDANQVLHGRLHNWAIWARQLTDQEVGDIWNAGKVPSVLSYEAEVHLRKQGDMDGHKVEWIGDCAADYCALDLEHATSNLMTSNYPFPKTALTFMTWVRLTTVTGLVPLLSYALSSSQNNEFLVYLAAADPNPLRVIIDGSTASTKFDGGVTWHERWVQVAVTWSSADGALTVYMDGAQVGTQNHKQGTALGSGGCLVIGQEQDSKCGRFAANQVLHGRIHDWSLWNYAMNASDIFRAYVEEGLPVDLKASAITHVNQPGVMESEQHVVYEPGCVDHTHPELSGQCVLDLEEDTSYATRHNYSFPATEFSFVTFFNISRLTGDHIPLLSYSPTVGGANTVLVALPNTGSAPGYGVRVWLNNAATPTSYKPNYIQTDEWHMVGVTWSSATGALRVWLDGIMVGETTHAKGQSIAQNPAACLTVGQEQDSPCGAFDPNQVLHGRIHNWAVFDHVLPDADIERIWWGGFVPSDLSGEADVHLVKKGDLEGHKVDWIGNCDREYCVVDMEHADSYLNKDGFDFPTTDLTFMTYVKSAAIGSLLPIISYAASGSNNEFLVYIDTSSNGDKNGNPVRVYLNNGRRSSPSNPPATDWHERWHMVAVTWSKSSGLLNTYVDGALHHSVGYTGSALSQGGCLVIGQEQDSPCGRFDANQVLHGFMHSWALFDFVVSEDDLLSTWQTGYLHAPLGNQALLWVSNPGKMHESHINWLPGCVDPQAPSTSGQCVIDLEEDTSYLQRRGFAFPPNAFTFSVFINMSKVVGDHIPLLSYSPTTGANNEVLIAFPQAQGYGIRVWIDNQAATTVAQNRNWVNEWHHIAVTWTKSTGKLETWLDGTRVGSQIHKKGTSIDTNSAACLTIGQEQDSPCGSFASGQVFHGQMHNWALWDRVLPDDDIERIFYENYVPGDLAANADLHVKTKDVMDFHKAEFLGDTCDAGYCVIDLEHKDSYMQLTDYNAMPTDEITFIGWFRSSDLAGSLIPFISYSAQGRHNEFLVFASLSASTDPITVWVKNKKVGSLGDVNWHERWHMVAITYAGVTGEVQFYVDGTLLGSKIAPTKGAISAGGCLVVGQEQDSACGRFATNQVLHGRLHDYALFDSVLPEDRILAAYHDGTLPQSMRDSATLYVGQPGVMTDHLVDWLAGCVDIQDPLSSGQCIVDLEEDTSYLQRKNYTFPPDAFTVTLFVNHSALVGDHIPYISYSPTTGGHNTVLVASVNSGANTGYGLRTWINNAATPVAVAPNVMQENTWHHIAVTWESSTGEVQTFLDGIQVGSGQIVGKGSTIAQNPAACMTIGQEQDTQCGGFVPSQVLHGQLHNWAVFDRVLSDAEIDRIYAEGLIPGDISSTADVHVNHKDVMIDNQAVWIGNCGSPYCVIDFEHPDSHLVTNQFPFPATRFSFMTWVRMSSEGDWTPLLSYAAPNEANAVLIGMDTSKADDPLSLYLHGTSGTKFSNVNWHERWHQVAVTWDSVTGNSTIYVDGAVVVNEIKSKVPMTTPGCLVAGQEQDASCSNFDPNQVLHGRMHDFSLWDSVLTDDEVLVAYRAGTLTQSLKDKAMLHVDGYGDMPDNHVDFLGDACGTRIPDLVCECTAALAAGDSTCASNECSTLTSSSVVTFTLCDPLEADLNAEFGSGGWTAVNVSYYTSTNGRFACRETTAC